MEVVSITTDAPTVTVEGSDGGVEADDLRRVLRTSTHVTVWLSSSQQKADSKPALGSPLELLGRGEPSDGMLERSWTNR